MNVPQRIDLNGCWRVQGFALGDKISSHTFDGTVPGHVHRDLLRAGIITDPFWREQAEDCQWVEHCAWHYTTTFALRQEQVTEWMLLCFEGLDTFAEVILNDVVVGRADNMFIPHEMEVSGVVRPGNNTLEVRFAPIGEAVAHCPMDKYVSLFSPERVFVRRMQCGFGWDWVHRFVSAGIWRPASLVCLDQARIADLFVHTRTLGDHAAALRIETDIQSRTDVPLAARLELTDPNGSVVYDAVHAAHEGRVLADVEIRNPALWWPNGAGEQPLYRCRCTLTDSRNAAMDSRRISFGIRTVSLIERPDAQGSSLVMEINGRPIFAKGANWAPADPFPGDIPDARYEHLLTLARQGHVNMLRVWGGGIYESPAFYDACDRLGVLIMQDFMLACAWYPEDDLSFMARLRREFDAAIRRLRNHPSLAIWCGDNELGMNEPEDSAYNGRAIADTVSGPLCAALDASRPFWKTSPYGGSPNNAPDRGDCHVSSWLDRDFQLSAMTDYRERIRDVWGRFVSEYVAMGMTGIETARRYAADADLRDSSGRVLAFHNKDNPYNGIDFADHFGMMRQTAVNLYGESPDPLVMLSRMEYEQYEWIRLACESLRRRKFDCAGLLFWMYNDCWPANGCSIVDYYGVPKAAYYAMKSGFKPVIACLEPGDSTVKVWLCNDKLTPEEAMVRIFFQTFTGDVRRQKVLRVSLAANSARCVDDVQIADLGRDGVLVCDVMIEGGTDRAWYFRGMPREMPLPEARVESVFDPPDRPTTVTVTTDVYARVVTLHGGIIASDNYFDLLPGETRALSIAYPDPVCRSPISITWWNREHP